MSTSDTLEVPEDFREQPEDLGCQVEAKQRVVHYAQELGDPRFWDAVQAYNSVKSVVDMADEYAGYAHRFVKIFKEALIGLNEGVKDLDLVRECVRRSFYVSQVVPFEASGGTIRWTTDEQIEEIAISLIHCGFVIPEKE